MRVYKNLQKRNIPSQQLHEAASEMESRNAPQSIHPLSQKRRRPTKLRPYNCVQSLVEVTGCNLEKVLKAFIVLQLHNTKQRNAQFSKLIFNLNP